LRTPMSGAAAAAADTTVIVPLVEQPAAPAPAKKKSTRHALLVVGAAAAVYMLWRWMKRGKALGEKLAAKGWVLVTQEGCFHCKAQLSELGGEYPARVRYAADGKTVLPGGPVVALPGPPTGFPLWFNTATKATVIGMQKKKALEAMVA
jgi:hypothetical protein